MKVLSWCAFLCLCLGAPTGGAAGQPPTIIASTPELGAREASLEELWHFDGLDDDVLVGKITRVRGTSDGTVYCLDWQLRTVHRFEPSGEYLGSVGREGEGPGELSGPIDLVLYDNGHIGIVDGSPSKIVRLTPDGEFVRDERVYVDRADAGDFSAVRAVRLSGRRVFFAGEISTLTEEPILYTTYTLGVMHANKGTWTPCFTDSVRNATYKDKRFLEEVTYYAHLLTHAWAVDHNAHVTFAPERNEYLLRQVDATGQVTWILRRDVPPTLRTPEVLSARYESSDRVFNRRNRSVELEIEKADPVILRIDAMDDGRLWVLNHGSKVQTGGQMAWTWDVFSANGRFEEQVVVACPGNMYFDELYLLPAGHVVRVRNAGNDERYLNILREKDTGPRAEAVEITCYRFCGLTDR